MSAGDMSVAPVSKSVYRQNVEPYTEVSSIRWRADVSNELAKFERELPLGAVVPVAYLPRNVYNEVSDLAKKDGLFSMKEDIEYRRILDAQRISDTNNDKQITGDEVEIYKAVRYSYGKPTIGGVKIDAESLSLIESISKDKEGNYRIKAGLNSSKNPEYVFSPQPENKKSKIEFSYKNFSKPVFTNLTVGKDIKEVKK